MESEMYKKDELEVDTHANIDGSRDERTKKILVISRTGIL